MISTVCVLSVFKAENGRHINISDESLTLFKDDPCIVEALGGNYPDTLKMMLDGVEYTLKAVEFRQLVEALEKKAQEYPFLKFVLDCSDDEGQKERHIFFGTFHTQQEGRIFFTPLPAYSEKDAGYADPLGTYMKKGMTYFTPSLTEECGYCVKVWEDTRRDKDLCLRRLVFLNRYEAARVSKELLKAYSYFNR